MIQIRPASERGQTHIGWLDSYHTFSFGDYHDSGHMSFRALRVMNDDYIAGGGGFGMHPHRDMEIVTYVLEGALQHRDSLGTGSVLRAGELQRMSAGTGILHSEFNASPSTPVHLYQIWLVPEKKGIAPGYEQKAFPTSERPGQLRPVVTRDGRDGTLRIQQDVEIALAALAQGEKLETLLTRGRHAWVQVLSGKINVNGHVLAAGDGAALSEEPALRLEGMSDGEAMVFDLA